MVGRSPQPLSSGIVSALADVARVITRHEGHAAVIGGIAVIARGVQRLTRDIDIAVAIDAADNAALAAELQLSGIVPRIADAFAFADENQVLLMRHAASAVDVDVSRASLPFELEALAASTQVILGGVHIAAARADDLVIFKAIAWRPQDQQDVERLLALHCTVTRSISFVCAGT